MDDDRPGSEERFAALFRHEYPQIVRVAYLMLGDRAAAEDVAQEAFTRLYARWWRVSRYDRPGAWARRVTIRLASRARGLRQRESGRMLEDPPANPPPAALDADVVDAIVALPQGQRAAVVLHYLEDMPVAEIADVLRCSPATARVHLHRGRKRLEQMLKEKRNVG